jgi:hypothetical protein
MSGSGSTGTFPFPTALGTRPLASEGSKVVNYPINWTEVNAANRNFTLQINLLSQYQSGQFTTVQAVYVDNSTNIYPVTIVCAESGQSVEIGPFSQGMFPLVSSPAAQYAVTLGVVPYPVDAATFPFGSTDLSFFNTPQAPYETQALAGGTNFQTVNGCFGNVLGPVVLLPGLAGPNQHYAFSAVSISLIANAGFAAPVPMQAYLQDGNESFYPWRMGFMSTTAAGLQYRGETTYPQPSMQYFGGNPILFGTTNSGTSGGFAYFGPPSGYFLVWEVTYGVVTIQ